MKFTVNKAFGVFFAVMGTIAIGCFLKALSIAMSAPPTVTEEMLDNSLAVQRWEANDRARWDCIRDNADKGYAVQAVFYVCVQQADQYYPRVLPK